MKKWGGGDEAQPFYIEVKRELKRDNVKLERDILELEYLKNKTKYIN
ncbi:MAG: hypothetical protein ACJAX4_001772 [Clostridium sp.]|jgi:hypothetical protein